jgi:hypothetical protein
MMQTFLLNRILPEEFLELRRALYLHSFLPSRIFLFVGIANVYDVGLSQVITYLSLVAEPTGSSDKNV